MKRKEEVLKGEKTYREGDRMPRKGPVYYSRVHWRKEGRKTHVAGKRLVKSPGPIRKQREKRQRKRKTQRGENKTV